jgi:hypothetical protein
MAPCGWTTAWCFEAVRVCSLRPNAGRLSLSVTMLGWICQPKPARFLHPLLTRVRAGVAAVATAAREGTLRVDDELHLTAMPAEDEDPKVIQLRAPTGPALGRGAAARK